MANLAFLTRIIQNVKSEADWIADENYQILPNQSVESYVTKQVEVDGVQKNMLFVRSKTNTTTSNKLFKDLPYNDEYLMYMVQDNIDTALQNVTDEVNTLSGTVSTMNVDVSALKTSVANNTSNIETLTTELENVGTLIDEKLTSAYKASGSVASASALPTADATTLGNVYNVTTEFDTTADFIEGVGKKVPAGSNVVIVEESTGVYKYDVVGSFVDMTNYMDKTETQNAINVVDGKADANATNIANMQSDLNTAVDEVSSLSGTVSTLNIDMANKMDKSGGTFTGDVQLPAISGTPTDTQAVTVKYMKDYIDANPAGTQVVLSATEPQNLPSGSIWLKQV